LGDQSKVMNIYERPYLFYSFIPLFLYAIYFYKKKLFLNRQEFLISSQKISNSNNSLNLFIPILLSSLKFISLGFLIYAAAGPGIKTEIVPEEKNGIDMMIAIDVSGSMTNSIDFLPKNRLEVSKDLISEFIIKRKSDRIGLVIFGGAAYLQAPLTGDLESLVEILHDVNETSVREEGTAIGDALALSIYRLKKSTANTRIILLLTDGVSNAGKIDSNTAAEAAKAFGVKIYSIGIGKELLDAYNNMDIDFESLETISQLTGGVFYKAADADQLEKILADIDSLEKSYLSSKPLLIVHSKFEFFLMIGMIFLVIDQLMKAIWLKHHV
jgi:Ca-activated chloride channel homolog